MSTFEPMSEEEIRGWLGSVHSGVERLAKTALHHLAHAKAAEEARASAEAEAAQTFRLKNYRIRIQRDGVKVWVKLFIDPICAPEIASLSAEQLSSLALVVTRG